MNDQAGGASASNDGLGPAIMELVEAAMWWHLCPAQGGYRYDGERGGRSIEDTCEALADACAELLGGHEREDGGWMSEEDAEAAIRPTLERVDAWLRHVRYPQSAAEAKAMAIVAIVWLREHAPDELRPEFRA